MFKELREELGIDSFVSLNGQYVVYKGEVIYTNRLETEVLKELTLFADKNDHPVAYIDATDMKVNTAEHVNIVTSIGSLKLAFPTYDAEYFC